MKCRTVFGIQIDCCDQCGGSWYDAGELDEVLGKGHILFSSLRSSQARTFTSQLLCPVCSLPMSGVTFRREHECLEIDICDTCSGIWLDRGEFQSVRKIIRGLEIKGDMHDSARLSALRHYESLDYDQANEDACIGGALYLFCLISQLPVEVYNPRKKFPLSLLLLTGMNALVWTATILFLISGRAEITFLKSLFENYGLVPFRFFLGEDYWSLFTYGFLHLNLIHLFVNMYMLWIFGDNVCDFFRDHGRVRGEIVFIVYYLSLVAIAGIFHSLLASGTPAQDMPLVGASGGVSGIMAGYWRLFPKTRLYQVILFITFKMPVWAYVMIWFFYQLLLGLKGGMASSVSWSAHIAGFAAGYILIPFFAPGPKLRQDSIG
jgi:membrane associated rhomboid family serine protease/Zn-finger nucleic acid-binding protein